MIEFSSCSSTNNFLKKAFFIFLFYGLEVSCWILFNGTVDYSDMKFLSSSELKRAFSESFEYWTAFVTCDTLGSWRSQHNFVKHQNKLRWVLLEINFNIAYFYLLDTKLLINTRDGNLYWKLEAYKKLKVIYKINIYGLLCGGFINFHPVYSAATRLVTSLRVLATHWS